MELLMRLFGKTFNLFFGTRNGHHASVREFFSWRPRHPPSDDFGAGGKPRRPAPKILFPMPPFGFPATEGHFPTS
jgi:hypothetical protein